ncbi:hypothetical protein JCM14469_14600 [Desulfatiferula olefinivorans]
MKKILLGLTMLLTVTAFSGPAFAYFEQGKLILSVYNENDMDLGVDLGDALALSQNTASNVVLAQAGTVTLDKFGDNVDSWSDLSAAAWGGLMNTATNTYQMYMAMTETISPAPSTNMVMNFFAATADTGLTGYGDSNFGEQYAVIASTDINSYDNKLNRASNAPGTFAALNGSGNYRSEVNLATLETLGYADLNLYAYDLFNNQAGLAGGNAPNAVIRIMADGGVLLNPGTTPEVPLPGSLILLSSGLLGMIGIRRKNA